jgi:hypothetical protein
MKEDYNFSTNLYLDYKNDIEWQKDSYLLDTKWKKDEEILSELNTNLWN